MSNTTSVSGESFDHKVAAVVDTQAEADTIAQEVVAETSIEQKQVIVVSPGGSHEGHKLEPEDRGIVRTGIRAHIRLGIIGVVLGLVLFLLLLALDVGLARDNGMVAALVLMFFGGVFGLLAGGVVMLRPDHEAYLVSSQSALRKGKFVITVHARSHEQLEEAKSALGRRHLKLVASA